MNTPVYITQAHAVTSLGPDIESIFRGLLEKKSGISRVTRFDTSPYAGPCGGIIQNLDNEKEHPLILQLADMLIDQLDPVDTDTLLITASTKAGIDDLDKSVLDSELVPQSLLLSNLTHYICRKTGITRGGFNINSACASSTIAIAKGAALIETGAVDSVLICCLDTVSQFVFSGFSAIGAMSQTPARPFDKNRSGLTLGEGAAAIELMNEQKALHLDKTALSKVTGWGSASDAHHLTAPARNGSGLIQAIFAACKKASVKPNDIDVLNTHGTGTLYNDAMELHVMNKLFSTSNLTANSIKGAIGHTLGAAGGIEAALCVEMIKTGIIPPTIGLESPEETAEKFICGETEPLKGNRILTTNSGFGGINAALVLEGC